MRESARSGCAQIGVDITRYAYGELPAERTAAVESHVKGCKSCSDFVIFVQKFNSAAKEGLLSTDAPHEPCPAASLLVDLEAEGLEANVAQNVRAHLLHCKACRDQYLLLCKLSQEHFEERALASHAARPSWFECTRPVNPSFAV